MLGCLFTLSKIRCKRKWVLPVLNMLLKYIHLHTWYSTPVGMLRMWCVTSYNILPNVRFKIILSKFTEIQQTHTLLLSFRLQCSLTFSQCVEHLILFMRLVMQQNYTPIGILCTQDDLFTSKCSFPTSFFNGKEITHVNGKEIKTFQLWTSDTFAVANSHIAFVSSWVLFL